MKRDDKIKRSQTPLTALLASDQYLSEQAVSELERLPIEKLTQWSHQRRDLAHGTSITYSKKVFIPLTQLCRDVCHYCTFAQPPKKVQQPYLSLDQVLEIARAGEQAGCQEALFTLGEKPELRYPEAREWLDQHGYATTLDYLAAAARTVLTETSLLPHLNPGCMTPEELAALRPVSASMGIMLESASERLCEKGGPHYGSPDKHPQIRLATIQAAGEQRIPFTSGLLIGIGETRAERIDTLIKLRQLHEQHGHLQEIIIQNFKPKPYTGMALAPEPSHEDLLWTIAMARLIFPPEMNIQAPPNLSPGKLKSLIEAGINDWGGVSPITPDHVNPEAPWPHLEQLRLQTKAAGKQLVQRLTAYPSYVHHPQHWFDKNIHPALLKASDAEGLARDTVWTPGRPDIKPPLNQRPGPGKTSDINPAIAEVLARIESRQPLGEQDIVTLFSARGSDVNTLCSIADQLREAQSGHIVRYVVNRNINYTNICYFHCQFCAFAKSKKNNTLRGQAYLLDTEEVVRRAEEAWHRGATEVCLQGGIHPSYTGQTYIDICQAIKTAIPEMHIHAFSPLEIWQGAKTLGVSIDELLKRLKQAGLNTLPGTAAEILDDEVRAIICPDKINTQQWLDVIAAAHQQGINTTSTMMFGHVEHPIHWARHLLTLRALQMESLASRTGRITEFVPLPYVPAEAPMFLRGRSRSGPTFREVLLMHAVARLVLHPYITHIQTSWPKLGPDGVSACLQAGANDLGGTLMNESISRAAGAGFGQEFPPKAMQQLITSLGRHPQQRNTLYEPVSAEQVNKAMTAVTLTPIVQKVGHPQNSHPPKAKGKLVRFQPKNTGVS
ncbi:MAG TPA: 7,8-didemethyl-8-hydroxy-5-deazariboflavin synthase [Gammaproteobacteria bacterium]|nr:7,8-didemethyl-8-hydroxy-5-deazariboflavin synthase [Gammaproteobacteria bacterium]